MLYKPISRRFIRCVLSCAPIRSRKQVSSTCGINVYAPDGHTQDSHSNEARSKFNSQWLKSILFVGISAVYVSRQCESSRSCCDADAEFDTGIRYQTEQSLTNWSSTHSCNPERYYEPTNAQEVCRLLESHHLSKRKIRAVGTALSPNGIGMTDGDALSLGQIDYVEVDPKRRLVTVGAGARVSDVLKELNEYGLTLENFSSIQEQQIGGWTQVSAHGTGCTLPTVEEMIVRMKLATPTEGLITLSNSSNMELFQMAKVGLGALGVVTELTLRCVPKFNLLEQMYTTTVNDIHIHHTEKLKHFRHVRYMWVPYTSKVVVVASNPPDKELEKVDEGETLKRAMLDKIKTAISAVPRAGPPTKELCDLLLKLRPNSVDKDVLLSYSFSQLRDLLLDIAPLDVNHIKQVNRAEAAYWEQSAGSRQDDSTNILGFDCGGEQWVLEVCFPIGALESKTNKDLTFVKELLRLIEHHQIPAPGPIEQRWTARSTAPMSPAFSDKEGDIFSWVGVIMYMPPNQTASQREDITNKFRGYVQAMRPLMEAYGAQCHWAKIELPYKELSSKTNIPIESSSTAGTTTSSVPELDTCPTWYGTTDVVADSSRYDAELQFMRRSLARKYPVERFNRYRQALDPKCILSNNTIDELFNKK